MVADYRCDLWRACVGVGDSLRDDSTIIANLRLTPLPAIKLLEMYFRFASFEVGIASNSDKQNA